MSMNQSKITFIVNGNTHCLDAGDTQALRKIPSADRQQLMVLLNAVKTAGAIPQSTTQNLQTAARPNMAKHASAKSFQSSHKVTPSADELMARLIVEDRSARGEGLTKKGVYIFIGVFTTAVILLVVIFGS